MRIPISQQQLEVYPKNEHQLLRNSSLYICVVRKISLSSFGEPVEVKITTLGDLTIFQKFDQFLLALYAFLMSFQKPVEHIISSYQPFCGVDILHSNFFQSTFMSNNQTFCQQCIFFQRKCIDIFSDISWRLKVACLNLFKILRLDKLEFDLSVLILEP
ncbi:unnamed protein product [Rhizophagus irregularis]|nr:unnamed protein product [Rhizophagus irregularis]